MIEIFFHKRIILGEGKYLLTEAYTVTTCTGGTEEENKIQESLCHRRSLWWCLCITSQAVGTYNTKGDVKCV